MVKLRRCPTCRQRCHHRREVRLGRSFRMVRGPWRCTLCGHETASEPSTPHEEIVELDEAELAQLG